MNRLTFYVFRDIIRSKVLIAFTLFMMLVSFASFSFDANVSKGLLGLLNLEIIVWPMICLIFSTIHLYNSAEFIQLLAAQPLRRSVIFNAQYFGVLLSLLMSVLFTIGLPLLWYGALNAAGLTLLFGTLMCTAVFTSLAFLGGVYMRDKARGIGFALLMWFFFAMLFDGLVMLVMFLLNDYPLENFLVVLSMLNPLDMARISVILQMDASAMLGVTGAVFSNFFSSSAGMLVGILSMLIWSIWPFLLARKKFRTKDL